MVDDGEILQRLARIERIANALHAIGNEILRRQEEQSVSPIMKYFEFAHLPPHLREVSAPVGELAKIIDESLPDSAEKSAGLRKLLEAKDCFVRAKLG